MKQSACELVRKDEPFDECHRCPLFINRYMWFVDEKELSENDLCGQKSISQFRSDDYG